MGHWILNLFPSSHSTGPIMNPITAPAPTRKSNNVEMNEWVRKWQEWKKSKKEFQRKNWGYMFLFFQSTVDIKFWLWNCLLTMFISLCFSLFLVHLLGSYYFPLNLTRKQPKVCMFYLFLFLQNNLLTSTELNSIYSDFTDHSVAGCGTSSASPPRSWETSCTVQSTAVSRDMTEGVLVVWLVSRSRIDVRVNVSAL